jgi:hypothetical protein
MFAGVFGQTLPKIPNSVTHLLFCSLFDQSIKGLIPNSVTHLKLNLQFDHFIKEIPLSVTHLTTYGAFTGVDALTSTSITHLKINDKKNYAPLDKFMTCRQKFD